MCPETRLISLLNMGRLHQMVMQKTALGAPALYSNQKCSFTKNIQRKTCLHRQGILTLVIFYLCTCDKLFCKRKRETVSAL